MLPSLQNASGQALPLLYGNNLGDAEGSKDSFENLLAESEGKTEITTAQASHIQSATDPKTLFNESHSIVFHHYDGTTTIFPPGNAPENIKQAWKNATAGMSEMDVATMVMCFHPLGKETVIGTYRFSINVTAQGRYIPLTNTASYIQRTKAAIEEATFSSKIANSRQVEMWKRQIATLENFLANLQGIL